MRVCSEQSWRKVFGPWFAHRAGFLKRAGELIQERTISLQSVDANTRWSAVCGGRATVKRRVDEHLLSLNAGFEQARRSMAALRRDGFDREALERFIALAEEARAATVSYLAGAIGTVETNEAGRRFRKRIARERHDDEPS